MVMRKPTQQKLAEGNPGKRDLDIENEIQPEIRLPDAPEFLNNYAKEEWNILGPQLVENKLITDIDKHQFALLCQAWGRWKEAEEELEKEGTLLVEHVTDKGNVTMKPSPYLEIIKTEVANIHKFLQYFGMSPVARAGLRPGGGGGSESDWAKFKKRSLIKNGKLPKE